MKGYDFIVLGVGGMGSAALYHLARRGHRVLGLERFSIAHDRGSSHGQTRIIRKAYFEHPDYVPLLLRAYDLWDELARKSGRELLVRCGLLLVGAPEGPVIRGVRRAAAVHGLAVEDVAPAELARRFPGFALSEDMVAMLEPDGGYLCVEECVRAHAAQAHDHGAELREGEVARAISFDGPGASAGVSVETDRGRYRAGGLVICGGAYSGPLFSALALPLDLQIRRKIMFWYDVPFGAYRIESGCPAFAFDTAQGFFYGFPVPRFNAPNALEASASPGSAALGLKVAEHTGGEVVADALALDRSLRPGDEAPVRAFLSRHLPLAAQATRSDFRACMYTMTADEHFIIDRHPERGQIAYAAGFSGHGFKFASVVGEVLADLATTGRSAHPIGFLSASRLRRA